MLPRRPITVFLLVWIVTLITMGGHLYSPDEEIMFRMTERLATEGQTYVEPIWESPGSGFATKKGVDGLEYPQYGVGNSLFAVPLYWIGTALTYVIDDATAYRLLNFETVSYLPDSLMETQAGQGHALLKRTVISLFGGLVAAGIATVIFVLVRGIWYKKLRERTNTVASLTALAAALTTIMLPHARTYFSEPLATFFILASFAVIALPNEVSVSKKRVFYSGLLFAGALLTRLDSIIIGPAIGLYVLWNLPWGDYTQLDKWAWLKRFFLPQNLGRIILFNLPVLGFFAFYCWQNQARFGDPFVSAYSDQTEGINFSTPLLAGLYGFLFSIGKSVFLFSPGLLFVLMGWRNFSKRFRGLAACLGVAILFKLLLHASWQNWAGGWCWGPRHIYMIHPLLMVFASGFFAMTPLMGRRIFTEITFLVGFCVQLYGSSQSFVDYYILYYRTPTTPPSAYALYGPEDSVAMAARVEMPMPDGTWLPISVRNLQAPINDSIYLPQNSQWPRYAEMFRLGYRDNFWMRLQSRANGKEPKLQ